MIYFAQFYKEEYIEGSRTATSLPRVLQHQLVGLDGPTSRVHVDERTPIQTLIPQIRRMADAIMPEAVAFVFFKGNVCHASGLIEDVEPVPGVRPVAVVSQQTSYIRQLPIKEEVWDDTSYPRVTTGTSLSDMDTLQTAPLPREGHACTQWCIQDVLYAARKAGVAMTAGEAHKLLVKLAPDIRDAMIQRGWEIIDGYMVDRVVKS